MVKITFSAPKVVAQQLQQYELKLKEVGIARNSWLTQVVEDGMDRRFLLKDKPEEHAPDVLAQVRAAVDAMRDTPALAQWVQRFDVALGDAKEPTR